MEYINDIYDELIEDEEESFSEDEDSSKRILVARCAVSAVAALVITDQSFNSIPPLPGRVGNNHRDRELVLLTVRDWDDDMFRRQFRLFRSDFNGLLIRLNPYLTKNCVKARNSSGCPINSELQLLITLRVLAGASYLDMIWYSVSVNHVMDIVVRTCELINTHLNNISFPAWQNEDEYVKLAHGWQHRIYRKFGGAGEGILNGVISAGDGIIFQIKEPRKKDLDGKPSVLYMNRKGFFSVNAQAFCDSNCRFQYFEMKWPGSTSDCTAFRQSDLYIGIINGMAPDWAIFVCDEAYSCYGGRYLTPFSKYQLMRTKIVNPDLYNQMRAYNHVLSSLRIHIERAFGQLVRRWGILWRALEMRLTAAITIIECCARLHNLCVDSWLRDHAGSIDGFTTSIPEHTGIPHMSAQPDDTTVMSRLNNDENTEEQLRSMYSEVRNEEMSKIFRAGIVVLDD